MNMNISCLLCSLFSIENTVGFRLGGYRAGDITVMEPTACSNIPQAMKDVAKVNLKVPPCVDAQMYNKYQDRSGGRQQGQGLRSSLA